MPESYCYHGHMITIVEGAFHTNALIARPDGNTLTIPAADPHTARRLAQYAIRRRERGRHDAHLDALARQEGITRAQAYDELHGRED